MNELQFFAIAIIAIGILCKLDGIRAARRAQNRRNWLWLIHAKAVRRDAERAWGSQWDLMSNTAPWTEPMRAREQQLCAAMVLAGVNVRTAYNACKGKCPDDLIIQLLNT